MSFDGKKEGSQLHAISVTQMINVCITGTICLSEHAPLTVIQITYKFGSNWYIIGMLADKPMHERVFAHG